MRPKRVVDGEAVESDDEAVCALCGRPGLISDWSGDDPANAGTEELVLCADGLGRPVCDDCYAETDGEPERVGK